MAGALAVVACSHGVGIGDAETRRDRLVLPAVSSADEGRTWQANGDGDALGDACDPCPQDPQDDQDQDGRCADAEAGSSWNTPTS